MKKEYEIREVAAAGARIDCLIFGSGKRPFVILPGLSVGSVMKQAKVIRAAYSCFANEYTVCLIDRRKNLPAHYPIAEMARDTEAAMDALGFAGAALYGVSQGGMIAQRIAIDRPDLVEKLVLVSTLPEVAGVSETTVGAWLEAAEKGRRKALADAFLKAVYTEEFQKKYRAAFLLSSLFLKKSDLARFRVLAEGTRGFSVTGELSKIVCPTLVLGAENDRVTGSEGARKIAGALGCEIYLYPEPYRHAVYDEAPDIKERILRFLEKEGSVSR